MQLVRTKTLTAQAGGATSVAVVNATAAKTGSINESFMSSKKDSNSETKLQESAKNFLWQAEKTKKMPENSRKE